MVRPRRPARSRLAAHYADQPFHLAHGLLEADHDRPGDDAVADVQLVHALDGGDRAGRCGRSARGRRAGPCRLRGSWPPARRRVSSSLCWSRPGRARAYWPGVQLDGVGAEVGGGLDLPQVGIEEQADDNAGVLEPVDHLARRDPAGRAMSSPPSVVTSSRRSGTSVAWSGSDAAGDVEHLVVAGHLQVQLHGDRLAQDRQVAVLDVAAILAQVERDAVGPAQFGQRGRPDRVGLVGPPRLPDGRHVVDVDAEFGHGSSGQSVSGQWLS